MASCIQEKEGSSTMRKHEPKLSADDSSDEANCSSDDACGDAKRDKSDYVKQPADDVVKNHRPIRGGKDSHVRNHCTASEEEMDDNDNSISSSSDDNKPDSTSAEAEINGSASNGECAVPRKVDEKCESMDVDGEKESEGKISDGLERAGKKCELLEVEDSAKGSDDSEQEDAVDSELESTDRKELTVHNEKLPKAKEVESALDKSSAEEPLKNDKVTVTTVEEGRKKCRELEIIVEAGHDKKLNDNENGECEDARKRESIEPQSKPESKRTIIVTETKSLQQAINNAVLKDNGSEGKPTLVIIETKSTSEHSSNLLKPSHCSSNSITVQTGLGKTPAGTTLTPIVSNSDSGGPTCKPVFTTGMGNFSIVPSGPPPPMIEDGGMAVEVPSLVVPYLIEYPPSRTISEFLKMLPLTPEELKELEDASRAKKAAAAVATPPGPSTSMASAYGTIIGRPKTADRWGTYFENSLGKFFMDIGLNLVKERVQTDLLKSQKRKTEKLGRNVAKDKGMINLVKNLADTKEKNEPFHFSLKKCEYCNFKTESSLVMKTHYSFPHQQNLDYKCNFCKFSTRSIVDIMFHMEAEHAIQAKMEKPPAFYQCPLCEFEDNSKAKVTKHIFKCQKKFIMTRNMAPPLEFDPPAKRPKIHPIVPPSAPMSGMAAGRPHPTAYSLTNQRPRMATIRPKEQLSISTTGPYRQQNLISVQSSVGNLVYRPNTMVYPNQRRMATPNTTQHMYMPANQPLYQSVYQVVNSSTAQLIPTGSGGPNNPRFTILPTATSNNNVSLGAPTPVALIPNIAGGPTPPRSVLIANSTRMQGPKPNISITPVTRPSTTQPSRTPSTSIAGLRPGAPNSSTFVVCEICDGYIKDLEQLRTHMQWIHKVKIHPKMIFNRPPLNCQKCQFRFFTDQGLERHLLGAHGLVTSSMQENANKGQDSGRCTICGKVFQWKLLAHMSKDHNMILKPAHLSYKCTVCAATFGMYKLFETHVYQAHSTVAKRVLDTPEDKKSKPQAPPTPQSTSQEPKPTPEVPPQMECSECGMPFSRLGNYYRHWENVHLKPCSIKLCKVDNCKSCSAKLTVKLPWDMDDESGSSTAEDDDSYYDKRTYKPGPASMTKHRRIPIIDISSPEKQSVKPKIVSSEVTLDMIVETPHEEKKFAQDDDDDEEEEETALDMEVESHDVDDLSPESVHTDVDDED